MSTSNKHGFNTIFNSQLPKREQRTLLRRIAIAACCGVLALILILSISMAIYTAFNGSNNNPIKDKDITYTDKTFTVDDTKFGSLVFVNEENSYTLPSDTKHLASIYDISRNKPYSFAGLSSSMDDNALTAMDAMLIAQNTANNVKISVRKAYPKDKISSTTTSNEFYTGLVVELKLIDNNDGTYNLADNQTVYDWFRNNAHKFGFIMYAAEERVQPGTSNYFRYIGVAHATALYDYNTANPDTPMNLKDYLGALKGYNQNNPFSVKDANNNQYLVYYTTVTKNTTIKVPTNCEYTVSGDNMGGVIVTINKNARVTPEVETTNESALESETESVTETTNVSDNDER